MRARKLKERHLGYVPCVGVPQFATRGRESTNLVKSEPARVSFFVCVRVVCAWRVRASAAQIRGTSDMRAAPTTRARVRLSPAPESPRFVQVGVRYAAWM